MRVEHLDNKTMRVHAFIWVPAGVDKDGNPTRKKLWGYKDVDVSKSVLEERKPKLTRIHARPSAWGHTFDGSSCCEFCGTDFNKHQREPAICPTWKKTLLQYMALRAARNLHKELHAKRGKK